MTGIQTEPIFQNLFSLLSQTQQLTSGVPNGMAAFVTSGRVTPQVSNVSAVSQPAIYIMEGEQDVSDSMGLESCEVRTALRSHCVLRETKWVMKAFHPRP